MKQFSCFKKNNFNQNKVLRLNELDKTFQNIHQVMSTKTEDTDMYRLFIMLEKSAFIWTRDGVYVCL